jgi:excisionase family DNA binding protein
MSMIEAGIEARILAPKWDNHSTFAVLEAAEILGESRPTAYARAKAGQYYIIRMGRHLRVPRWWLEKKLTGAA